MSMSRLLQAGNQLSLVACDGKLSLPQLALQLKHLPAMLHLDCPSAHKQGSDFEILYGSPSIGFHGCLSQLPMAKHDPRMIQQPMAKHDPRMIQQPMAKNDPAAPRLIQQPMAKDRPTANGNTQEERSNWRRKQQDFKQKQLWRRKKA